MCNKVGIGNTNTAVVMIVRLCFFHGMNMRMLIGFELVEPPGVFSQRRGLDGEDHVGVPSGIGYEANEGAGAHDVAVPEPHTVLIASQRTSEEYSIPPWILGFGA